MKFGRHRTLSTFCLPNTNNAFKNVVKVSEIFVLITWAEGAKTLMQRENKQHIYIGKHGNTVHF